MSGYGTPTSHELLSSTGTGNAHVHNGAPRSVKRPRPVKSCIECRTRKLRCDRLLPCSQCQKSQRGCRYAADGVAPDQDFSVHAGYGSEGSEGEASAVALDRKRNCAAMSLPASAQVEASASQSQNHNHNYLSHHQTPRNGSANMSTDAKLEDHGARLERLERMMSAKYQSPSVGGTEYHERSRPLTFSSATIRELIVKNASRIQDVPRTRFFGQNSTRVLLKLFEEASDFMFNRPKEGNLRETAMDIQSIHKALHDEHRKATTPIAVFVDSMTPIHRRMADILPKRPVCDQLVNVYLTGSESALYRTLHVGMFRDQYDRYWNGQDVPGSFLPQLLTILCIGYRFVGLGKGLQPDRDGIHLPTACGLVREWLDGLKGKQLVDFGTLQTETLLLMALRMIIPKFQESWTRLGYIVRTAMTMGLHRDPAEFPTKISPFWAEMRRRLWYTIMEIDLQMSMQCNMPACVRATDYTTRPPQNLDDEDLHPGLQELPDGKPLDQPTQSQIQVFSANTLIHRFKAVDLIARLHTLTDYQEVIDCGNALERSFEDVTFILPRGPPGSPSEVNKNWRVRTILDMTCRRALLALYRPFALSTPDVPHCILTSYLRSSVILLNYPDDLDPAAPTYLHIWHMHYLILKQDIIQAAFSVCYFIMHAAARNECPSPASSSLTRSSKSETIEEACMMASESSALLSLPRMIASVQKALDAMIRRIREIGTDMKDLTSLMVVLSFCQGGSWAQKQERANYGLRAIVETSMAAMRTNQETLVSLPILPGRPNSSSPMRSIPSPAGPSPVGPSPPAFQPSPLHHHQFVMPDEFQHVMTGTDDTPMWDVEFWDPFLHGRKRRRV